MARKNQSLHDWVISELIKTNGFGKYARDNACVLETNPSNVKNVSVGPEGDQIWPDVVIYDPKTKEAKRIAEVETDDTVTNDHAKGQWDAYGKKVSDFVLAVPKPLVKDAKEILKDLKATCTLWSYEIETDDSDHAKSAEFSVES
jgi:hypothetical protein